jgi:hypothetical protein
LRFIVLSLSRVGIPPTAVDESRQRPALRRLVRPLEIECQRAVAAVCDRRHEPSAEARGCQGREGRGQRNNEESQAGSSGCVRAGEESRRLSGHPHDDPHGGAQALGSPRVRRGPRDRTAREPFRRTIGSLSRVVPPRRDSSLRGRRSRVSGLRSRHHGRSDVRGRRRSGCHRCQGRCHAFDDMTHHGHSRRLRYRRSRSCAFNCLRDGTRSRGNRRRRGGHRWNGRPRAGGSRGRRPPERQEHRRYDRSTNPKP